jgi:hypothetical protein
MAGGVVRLDAYYDDKPLQLYFSVLPKVYIGGPGFDNYLHCQGPDGLHQNKPEL